MLGATMAAEAEIEPVEPQSLKKLSLKSLKRALDFFSPARAYPVPPNPDSKRIRTSYKVNAEYGAVKDLSNQGADGNPSSSKSLGDKASSSSGVLALPGTENGGNSDKPGNSNAIVPVPLMQPKVLNDASSLGKSASTSLINNSSASERFQSTSAIMERIPSRWPRPVWRPPWKNYRVISGHLGWVRSIAFNSSNDWFCTGSADRTIKLWDLASGKLKLSLTGHIEQVRGIVPEVKEYLRCAEITCGDPMIVTACFAGAGEIATKKFMQWVHSYPKYMEDTCRLCRIVDDVNSCEFEQERGHVASVIDCYMKEHKCIEEEAVEKLNEDVTNTWKDINKACMRPSPFPMAAMNIIRNLSRVMEVLYQFGDGYTFSNGKTKEDITLLLIDPIPI